MPTVGFETSKLEKPTPSAQKKEFQSRRIEGLGFGVSWIAYTVRWHAPSGYSMEYMSYEKSDI